MNRLASISSGPTLREFAQGAAQQTVQPVADFIAPTVPVGVMNGRYKVYTEKNRFRLPNTLRAIGGRRCVEGGRHLRRDAVARDFEAALRTLGAR